MKETRNPGTKNKIAFLILTLTAILALASPIQAQTFETIPALQFTMPFGGGNPLPQVLMVASTGASFQYTSAASTSQGGSWLVLSQGGCCGATPGTEVVSVANAGSLAAGTYNGQVVFTSRDGSKTLTVPVTLTVEAATSTFFDSLPGALSFSMKTNGSAPPAQTFSVRNAGSGTLSWTLSTSTADGGNWLSASATSGTAPSDVTIGITASKLPNGGAIAGTFDGQVVLQTSGNSVTIPISVTVNADAYMQLNPISYTMPFGGGSPLPQILAIASTGASFQYITSSATAQGGSWLTLSQGGCCGATPGTEVVSVVNASKLPAGFYGGEVIIESRDATQTLTVPVSLTVEPATAAFFDSLPGALSFSMETNGSAPPAQTFSVRNAGSGTLAWTVTTSTADGGSWLSVSAASGTAPSEVGVEITPGQLPNGGAIAGTFDGQLLFHSSTQDVTVPVSVTVSGDNFVQLNPISFTMPFAGGNPLPQVLAVASTGASFQYIASAATSQGGNWLTISQSGCCGATPGTEIVSVVNAGTLAAGTYSGEVILESRDATQTLTVPVTLTVGAATAAFFDSAPGELSFSMKTGGTAPPAQTMSLRNGGKGKLKFTLEVTTADGGNWLTATPASGAAPKTITVKIAPKELPGQGLIPGTFNGQLFFHTTNDDVTVPISVTVAGDAYVQLNPISFVMPFGGANPLPQVLPVASTGASFQYIASSATSQGGSWLQISQSGCCGATSGTEYVSVVNAGKLAAGTYTGEVILESRDATQTMTVPVTLVVEPVSKAFFDNIPGETSFSFTPTSSGNPPTQIVPVYNGGTGTLNWTAKTSTGDGGKWLKVAPTKGAAPGTVTVSVTRSKLPGKGQIAGTFVGQEVLQTATGNVTVQAEVSVGASVFVPLPALTFTTKVGGNPPSQNITLSSTGSSFQYLSSAFSSKGGSWLQISQGGCCGTTPGVETVSVSSSSLAVGTYIGEISFESRDATETMTVPVILTVTSNDEEESNGSQP